MINRRTLLRGLAGAAVAGLPATTLLRSARAQNRGEAKNLILLMAYGGWDTTYCFDPKPGLGTIDAPAGSVQTNGALSYFSAPTRPSVDAFFAAYGSQVAILNGVQMQSIVHSDCAKRLLTGTASDANPDVGTIVAYELGRSLPAPYLVLGTGAYGGSLSSISARAGTLNQVRTLLDPAAAFPPADPTVPPRFAPDAEEAALIRDYVETRAKRVQAARGAFGTNKGRYEDFLSALSRGETLRDFSDGFGNEFQFTLTLNEQIGLGLDAIERGVCHSLMLGQAFATWDTHAGNAQQDVLHEALFAALIQLGDELSQRPGKKSGRKMIDETVVAVISEMGRTPKLNAEAGKDHWPVTSAMVFGAGVKTGVYGQSTDGLLAENVDFTTGAPSAEGKQLQYTNLASGLLSLCGVDPQPWLPNAEAFDAFVV